MPKESSDTDDATEQRRAPKEHQALSRHSWEDAKRRQDERVISKLFKSAQAGENNLDSRQFAALLDFLFPATDSMVTKIRRKAGRSGLIEWTGGIKFVRVTAPVVPAEPKQAA